MSKARILIGYGQFRRQTDVSPGIYTDDGDAPAAEAAVEDWFAIITVWHGVSPYIEYSYIYTESRVNSERQRKSASERLNASLVSVGLYTQRNYN